MRVHKITAQDIAKKKTRATVPLSFFFLLFSPVINEDEGFATTGDVEGVLTAVLTRLIFHKLQDKTNTANATAGHIDTKYLTTSSKDEIVMKKRRETTQI